ncbi:MAG: carboxymuconolactone decarboxylase family protein [Phycisphaerae bacterium]|nr:carboxymuconolactone decarboxylase family protein [Phycisphaerae bacterium]
MKQLHNDTKAILGKVAQECPEMMQAFQSLHQAGEAGPLDLKTVELIAIGHAIIQQCTYCIAFHVKNALDAGATRAEIMQAASVSVVMGGGPALMYATEVARALDDFGA